MNLFVNYYQAKDEERQKEIDFCFDKNFNNPLIDRVIIFHSKNSYLTKGVVNKQEWIDIEIDRPTYQDFFNTTKDYPNDINIICNSDIFFDETLEHANRIKDNEVFCLTRWEWNDGNIIDFNRMHGAPPRYSQDCWVFKGACRLNDCDKVWAINQETGQPSEIPFTLGVPGNDNFIAYKFKSVGYNVRNPSLTIKPIHVHKERQRDYGHKYRITGTPQGGMNWGKLLHVEQTEL